MRFEVPQFIEIEDKIFGPFTWKQFVYILGGGGLLFMLFAFLPFFLFLIVAGPVAALVGALAFYKVNNRPFANILESVIYYFTNSRLYLWQKAEKKPKAREGAPRQTYLPPGSSSLASMSRKLEINVLNKRSEQ